MCGAQGVKPFEKRFERFFVRGRGQRKRRIFLVSELGLRIFFQERNFTISV
jgi:hypothetical protein